MQTSKSRKVKPSCATLYTRAHGQRVHDVYTRTRYSFTARRGDTCVIVKTVKTTKTTNTTPPKKTPCKNSVTLPAGHSL